ncbi:uncharacterized protein LOC125202618 isoform X2 [Salvia hispanica]|uniref:uncharacterized protein LOC125202618 isoform X2 n=1 Tax=Salvia hispanica TaxID=49212 RepID=UPI002009AE1B|nr:uncharacterized protein LOC125202618 isoform X2 [Salvia hispanica]
MALLPSKGVVVSVPTLVLSAAAFAILLFFLLSASSPASVPCSCSTPTGDHSSKISGEHVSTSAEDIDWLKSRVEANGLHMQQNILRKGINPRTREQQLQDLLHFKGISHYEGEDANNHTALPCPGELLVEEHHSNYGEPWAGGRDVFEFLAESAHVTPNSKVLEIGCGTLRVGLHFIRYLDPEHYHCLERDELSLMAALRYELPSQGLLYKRPLIVRGEDMDFSLERLVGRLKPLEGRIFVSHNVKFCSRLGGEECTKRLTNLGLEYKGKHTHDSLLFNHYEIWFEFRRFKS